MAVFARLPGLLTGFFACWVVAAPATAHDEVWRLTVSGQADTVAAGVTGSGQMALSGVFVRDGMRSTMPVAWSADNHQAARRETRPSIGQPFFIGDGLPANGLGAPQTLWAPPSATRLYLGLADGAGLQGPPGHYGDNPGALTVQVDLSAPGQGLRVHVPDPLTFTGQGTGGIAVYTPGLVFTGQQDESLVITADQTLIFTGQDTGPVEVTVQPSLRFVGQGHETHTVFTDSLSFIGQGSDTRTRYADRLMFEGQHDYAGPREIQLFSRVAPAASAVFRPNTDPRFQIDTTEWDRTPFRVTDSFEGTVTVPPGTRVTLAGNDMNSESVRIDNFIVLEIGAFDVVAFGAVHPVQMDGQPLEVMARGYTIAPDDLDITRFFRPGVPTTLRAHALDYGGDGYVSDVFLIIRDAN